MAISDFNDLLFAAGQQPIPQRLLFLFTSVELPSDATDAQRADFAEGHGGSLVPIMSVDKTPESISSFRQLAQVACTHSPDWKFVFVAALQNPLGHQIDSAMVEDAIRRMTQNIEMGQIEGLIPFDRQGEVVHFQ